MQGQGKGKDKHKGTGGNTSVLKIQFSNLSFSVLHL